METTDNHNKTTNEIADRDVLGLEKSGTSGKTNSKPMRIFLGLAIIILAVIAFWFFTKH